MATAKNRAIDLMRRNATFERKQEELARDVGMRMAMERSDFEAAARRRGRRRPARPDLHLLPPGALHEARVALTLRLLGGLTTPEIARAFLVRESTIAQRLVRAKRTLRDAGVPLRGSARRGAQASACPRCWR